MYTWCVDVEPIPCATGYHNMTTPSPMAVWGLLDGQQVLPDPPRLVVPAETEESPFAAPVAAELRAQMWERPSYFPKTAKVVAFGRRRRAGHRRQQLLVPSQPNPIESATLSVVAPAVVEQPDPWTSFETTLIPPR